MNNKNLKITVVGIGGGAQKTIDYLFLNNKSSNIKFALINSDKEFLECAKTENKLLIHGKNKKFYGLGCGGDLKTGEEYAEFCIDKIEQLFTETNVAVLISCFGGGCGTGTTPVIAKLLKSKGIKTIAIITRPFNFEGDLRATKTNLGINKLDKYADKIIDLENQNLLETLEQKTSLKEVFDYSNQKITEILKKEIDKL